jgi:hypothetical protein
MTKRTLLQILDCPKTAAEELSADRHIRQACAAIQAGWTPRQEAGHRCGYAVDRQAVLIGGRLFAPVEFPLYVDAVEE